MSELNSFLTFLNIEKEKLEQLHQNDLGNKMLVDEISKISYYIDTLNKCIQYYNTCVTLVTINETKLSSYLLYINTYLNIIDFSLQILNDYKLRYDNIFKITESLVLQFSQCQDDNTVLESAIKQKIQEREILSQILLKLSKLVYKLLTNLNTTAKSVIEDCKTIITDLTGKLSTSYDVSCNKLRVIYVIYLDIQIALSKFNDKRVQIISNIFYFETINLKHCLLDSECCQIMYNNCRATLTLYENRVIDCHTMSTNLKVIINSYYDELIEDLNCVHTLYKNTCASIKQFSFLIDPTSIKLSLLEQCINKIDPFNTIILNLTKYPCHLFIRCDAFNILYQIEKIREKIKCISEKKEEIDKLICEIKETEKEIQLSINNNSPNLVLLQEKLINLKETFESSMQNYKAFVEETYNYANEIYAKSVHLCASSTKLCDIIPNPEYEALLCEYNAEILKAIQHNWIDPYKSNVITCENKLTRITCTITKKDELLDTCLSLRNVVFKLKNDISSYLCFYDNLSNAEIIDLLNSLEDCNDIVEIQRNIEDLTELSNKFNVFMHRISASLNYEELIHIRLNHVYNFLTDHTLLNQHEDTILQSKVYLDSMINKYLNLVKCNAEKTLVIDKTYNSLKERMCCMSSVSDEIQCAIEKCKSKWNTLSICDRTFFMRINPCNYTSKCYLDCIIDDRATTEFINLAPHFIWECGRKRLVYTGSCPINLTIKLESLCSNVSSYDTYSRFIIHCCNEAGLLKKQCSVCCKYDSGIICLKNDVNCIYFKPYFPIKITNAILSVYYNVEIN